MNPIKQLAAILMPVVLACAGAHAADAEYPARPVKLIVPFATGGISDFIGRVLADGFKDATGTAMLIENRPGAGGTIGMDAVAKSVPDGYSLGLATLGFASNTVLQPSSPYDSMRDFTPLLMIGSIPSVIVVHLPLDLARERDEDDPVELQPVPPQRKARRPTRLDRLDLLQVLGTRLVVLRPRQVDRRADYARRGAALAHRCERRGVASLRDRECAPAGPVGSAAAA